MVIPIKIINELVRFDTKYKPKVSFQRDSKSIKFLVYLITSNLNMKPYSHHTYCAQQLADSPHIKNLMSLVNSHPASIEDMDSCVMHRYTNHNVKVRLHSISKLFLSVLAVVPQGSTLGPINDMQDCVDTLRGIHKVC